MGASRDTGTGDDAGGGRLDDLPFLDVRDPMFTSDRVRMLRELGERSWIFRSERGVEVLGYEPHATFLRDRRLSQDHSLVLKASGITDSEVWRFRTSFLTSTVGHTHARIRSAVAPFFGVRYVEGLRQTIREMIDGLLDSMATDSPVDLFSEICVRVPAMTYAHLVGAPLSDEAFIIRMSDSILQIFKRDASVKPVVEEAYTELFAYIDRQFTRALDDPRGDLLSRLVGSVQRGRVSRQEAIDLATLLLEASADNTANQMALVMSVLLEHPDQWRKVVESVAPVEAAVEEAIRIRPRTLVNDRVALEDLRWRGFDVPKGTRFTLSTVSAHRDPRAYPDPDVVDVAREKPKPTVMFGGGITICLGMNLARMEIQELVRALVRRFPRVRLADHADWRMGMFRAECTRLAVQLDGA